MRKIAIVFALSSLGCLSCGSDDTPASPPLGSIEGSVVEVASRAPVPGAEVILINPRTVTPVSPLVSTDRNGRYRIDDVEPGEYVVFVYHDTLVIFDRTAPVVRVEEGTVSQHLIRMMDSAIWNGRGFRVAGTVVDAETGSPVAGAFVEGVFDAWDDIRLLFQGITRPDWSVTDLLGRFSITVYAFTEDGQAVALEPIAVAREGYEPMSLGGTGQGYQGFPPALPLPPDGDSTLTVEVRLRPLTEGGAGPNGIGAIRGRVTFLGVPVPDLPVALSMLSSSHPDSLPGTGLEAHVPIQGRVVTTDSSGGFLLERLTPGSYVVHPAYLENDGYVSLESSSVRVSASNTTDAGEIEVAAAIHPVYPPNRAVVHDSTPEFAWEERPETTDYTFHEYKLYIATGHLNYLLIGGLTEARWQVPDSLGLAAGSHVSWFVDLIGESGESGLPQTIAVFENSATFTVGP